MKKVTKKDIFKQELKKRIKKKFLFKSYNLYHEIKKLKIDEGLQITRDEWPFIRKPEAGYLNKTFSPKKFAVQSLVDEKLKSDEVVEWIILRIK